MRRWGAFVAVAIGLVATATPAQAQTGYDIDLPPAVYGTHGMVVYPPKRLPTPVNAFTAHAPGALVDVRAQLPDGRWTEWSDTGVLDASAATVQVRLVLPPHGEVHGARVTLRQDRIRPHVSKRALSYRVYATREGLVGGTTANGHVIVPRDHFAALPSRRGLAPKASGSYTVQVCAANGRCAWAPVWDVGPWNTRDDYWNQPRQEWQDLPRGTPQAQAAFQDDYNEGRDQFGRDVRNPAGIDLGDGTFWDGLGLVGSAWVTVTYLWTVPGPYGHVHTPGDTLNVRDGTTSDAPVVGLAGHQAQVRVLCETRGELVSGSQGTTDVWLRIAPGKYVAGAFVSGVAGAATC